MGSATLISVGEYLGTTYDPDCDYVDGVLLERNVGEFDHSRLQTRLIIYLGNREQEWAICVVAEQRVQVKSHRFRVPDVCVVKIGFPIEPIYHYPPFLCIEVLSPDDRMSDMQEKIADYLDFGVEFVWVLDPRTRRSYIYTAAGSHEVKDGMLRAGQIEVPVSELYD